MRQESRKRTGKKDRSLNETRGDREARSRMGGKEQIR